MINPRFALRMRVQRNKDGWLELRFESKGQSTRIMVMGERSFGFSKCVEHCKELGIQKALDVSKSLSITSSYE